MSRVILIVDDFGPEKVKVVAAIRKLTQSSISEIMHLVSEGRPVVDHVLLSRQTPEFPSEFRALLQRLAELRVSYWSVEVPDDQSFDILQKEEYYEITAERLDNIIAAHAESIARQRQAGHSEASGQ